MSKFGIFAGVVGGATGALVAWSGWAVSLFRFCSTDLCSGTLGAYLFWVPVGLGAFLVLASVLALNGWRIAFLGAAGASVLIAAFDLLSYGFGYGGLLLPTSLALSVATLLLNILAWRRSAYKLPVGSHPMDMPVFG